MYKCPVVWGKGSLPSAKMLKQTHDSFRNQKRRLPMKEYYYIGLDIHKKTISYCIKTKDGTIVDEGILPASRPALSSWVK